MKNNKLAKFMALVLLVTLLAVILVSGTYAKYTTAVSAKDTATVARWNITLNGEDISKGTQKTLKLGLFDTINDTDFTSEESDVTAGKIAPGTTGQFEIAKLINNSDVNAQYKITYSIDNNNNIPLEFSKDKNAADSEWKSLSDFSMNNFEALSKDSTEGVSTGTIYWRWKFERNDDSADTDFGINTPEVVVTATITVEQVD
jgi:hypothetical protein